MDGCEGLKILYPDLENNFYEQRQQRILSCDSGGYIARAYLGNCGMPEKRHPGDEQPEPTGANGSIVGSRGCRQPGAHG